MTYHVAYASDTYDLMMKVNKHIRAGWEPIGGVTVAVRDADDGGQYTVLYQAMVKRESNTIMTVTVVDPALDQIEERIQQSAKAVFASLT